MQASAFNIVSRVKGKNVFFIVNLLSGEADLLSSRELELLNSGGGSLHQNFAEKGYLADPEQEQQQFQLRYIDFLENMDTEEVQVFFAPTYRCNFNCSYCYQAGYPDEEKKWGEETIQAFFRFLESELGHRKKYVTLFGGEPFLGGKAHREAVGLFIEETHRRGLDLAAVTNGYHLDEYLDYLSRVNVREIQVTLDGTSDLHNKRRPHQSGEPTFNRIVKNIDSCLDLKIPVNLRVVIDRENLQALPELARFAIDKGWTALPHFKTQMGRNYELHQCQSGRSKLFSRMEMHQALYDLLKAHPEIMEFHKPAFSVSRFLAENGHLPDPLFDACPACKSEWALDFTGKVYSCTATVGKPGEALGTFYPDIDLNREAISQWQKRNLTTIPECLSCSLQLACGGGCGSVAKNRNHNNLFSPDCRPVKELLEMGMDLYISE